MGVYLIDLRGIRSVVGWGSAEERMIAADQTQAEKDKIDRGLCQFLITPERREQVGGHPATQAIDYLIFAEKWNKDVM